MKKSIQLLIIILLSICFDSCKKEDTKAKDPCLSVNCLNNGYCANGACVCPEGYTGSNCSQQVTPSIVRINSIRVSGWPQTDNGAGWDLTSGPDIYVVIKRNGTTVYTSAKYTDAVSQININTNIELSNVSSTYEISIYDYDSADADDFIGGFTFVPYASNNSFPSILSVQNSSFNDIIFALSLSYSF
jgi:hypothetical protein